MKKNKLKLLQKIVSNNNNLSLKEESMKTLILENFTSTQIKLLIYLLKDSKKKGASKSRDDNVADNNRYNNSDNHDNYVDTLDKRKIDYFSSNISGRNNGGFLAENVIDNDNTYSKA